MGVKEHIAYYKNSINDSKMFEVDMKGIAPENEINLSNILIGEVDENTVSYLYGEKFGKNVTKAMENNKEIKVILCPLVFSVNETHGSKLKLPPYIIPIMMPALLNKNGKLKHYNEKSWLSRKLLKPTLLEEYAKGSMKEWDDSSQKRPLDAKHPSWNYFQSITNEILKEVTGMEINNFKIQKYTRTHFSYICIDESIDGTKNLEALFESLVDDEKSYNQLLKNFFKLGVNEQSKPMSSDLVMENIYNHLGQFANNFSLNESQRSAFVHYTKEVEGSVTAINGPPGTGKTTFLQSIIADEYVKAAIRKKEPPVIVAMSNNNQAVTNIIDSFEGERHNKNDALGDFWIPNIKSYGAYLVSQSKKNVEKYQTICQGEQLEGFFIELEKRENIIKAKDYYVEKYYTYANTQTRSLSLEQIINKIHKDLLKNVDKMKRELKRIQYLTENIRRIEIKYDEPINQVLITLKLKMTDKEQEKVGLEEFESAFDNWLNNLPLIKRILIRFKKFSIFYKRDLAKFVRNQKYTLKETFTEYESIENYILSKYDELKKSMDDLDSKKVSLENDINEINDMDEELNIISLKYCHKEISKNKILEEINNAFDLTYRYKAFKLSTHYFEGKWILECLNNIETNYEDKKSEEKRMKQWRRLAKLSPCFVSTFYMLPKFFEHFKLGNGNAWIKSYLYNFIDLVIVDEAGQASPEVCLPLFSLAKKALIVGDVLQIEPVWSVDEVTDIPNIEYYIGKESVKPIIENHYAAFNGNLMKIAKNRCCYRMFNEGGLYLREHWRCYNEIIAYCNQLAYNGNLIPKRGKSPDDHPIGKMVHIDCKGKSETKNRSQKNTQEAKFIVEWIADQEDTLIKYYQQKEGKGLGIHEIIGVVTPFTAHASMIKTFLKKHKGLQEITVGTVHKLQGAERRVIVFSTVYTKDNSQKFFFDRNVNMLNVAVSRAKDSFVVIGDCDILTKDKSTPSGLLATMLR
ncbi:MAG: AAA domain-containing protein [Lachnotalea sp.]